MVPPSELPAAPDSQGVFHFEDDRPSFESLAKENGFRYWSGRQLMDLLGYSSWETFRQVINKASTACMTIGANVLENFQQTVLIDGSGQVPDFKLSKFACYLIAMNGDPKKPAVARAQAYFATLAEAFQNYIQGAEDVERVGVRQRLRDHERSLSGIAHAHGVESYAFFQDQGYRGLYNMRLQDLRQHKGAPSGTKRPLLDFMGKRELAANLFRLTETEAKIESGDLQGQRALEKAAYDVGRSVRRTMQEAGGAMPEDLPLAPDIKKIHTDLKKTQKGLNKGKTGQG